MPTARFYMQFFRVSRVALLFFIVAALGAVDYFTGPEISVSIFYLIPVCSAAWTLGSGWGVSVALVSAITWFIAERLWNIPPTSFWIPYWNATVRFGFFVLTVSLICKTRRLNLSLQEKAASLSQQIAERERAEAALAQSRELFRLITENVSDLIAVLDLEGQRLYSSPSYQGFWGDVEALRGTNYFAQVVLDDRERVRAAFRHAVETGCSQRVEYGFACGLDTPRCLESEWNVIPAKSGQAGQVIVVSRDVTSRKRMEALYANEKEILEIMAEGKPLRDVLQKLVAQVEAWSIRLCCSILVYDSERRPRLHEVSGRLAGMRTAPKPEAPNPLRPSAGIPEPCAVIEAEWIKCREHALKTGLQIVYAQPVLSTLGETLGFLSIYSGQAPHPEAVRLQFFEKVAHLAAIALERQHSEEALRRLSSLILNAQEAERRRVARELHDSVNQLLATVAFRVESILPQIAPENHPVRQEVIKTRFLLNKAIQEVRSISENLRPSELDDLGLVAAVRGLCEDFTERTELEVQFSAPLLSERFPGEAELALYRIVQEALRNIEKHAEASEVTLSLTWDEAFISLSIRDNGKGLPARDWRRVGTKPGMGLIDMRERCAYLGGSFSIRSEGRLGTEVAVRIPRSTAECSREA